jgi:aspartyl-tRNA(Asn)/glutamyl-tRNA(Gln) amidotransferase subunit B
MLDAAMLAEIGSELPELPAPKRARLMTQYGLSGYDAGVLTSERPVADYFEAVVVAGADPKAAANWVSGEVMTGFNQTGGFAVPADRLAALIGLVGTGVVSHQAGRRVYTEMVVSGGEPGDAAKRLGVVQVRDSAALERWVEEVLAAHPGEVARYHAGETRLLGFLTGQVMKQSGGKADPKGVQAILATKLKGA